MLCDIFKIKSTMQVEISAFFYAYILEFTGNKTVR